jgi:hypothetical protein
LGVLETCLALPARVILKNRETTGKEVKDVKAEAREKPGNAGREPR